MTLYRLEDLLKRHGRSMARPTMYGWVGAAAMLLEPIAQVMRQELLAAKYAQSDDTGVRLLGRREAGGSKRSHLWVDRWGKGQVIYDFTKSRSVIRPQTHPQQEVSGSALCAGPNAII